MERWAEPAAETAAQPSLEVDVRAAASVARLYGLKFWSQPTAARVGRRNEQQLEAGIAVKSVGMLRRCTRRCKMIWGVGIVL